MAFEVVEKTMYKYCMDENELRVIFCSKSDDDKILNEIVNKLEKIFSYYGYFYSKTSIHRETYICENPNTICQFIFTKQ
jgi:hypothetical protein